MRSLHGAGRHQQCLQSSEDIHISGFWFWVCEAVLTSLSPRSNTAEFSSFPAGNEGQSLEAALFWHWLSIQVTEKAAATLEAHRRRQQSPARGRSQTWNQGHGHQPPTRKLWRWAGRLLVLLCHESDLLSSLNKVPLTSARHTRQGLEQEYKVYALCHLTFSFLNPWVRF